MEYELHLFEALVNGPMPSILPIEEGTSYRSVLNKKHGSCEHVTVATFGRSGRKFVLKEKSIINSLNPSYEDISSQTNLFENVPADHLAREVLALLHIDKSNVKSVEVENKQGKSIVRIRQKIQCESLPEVEARYYYYCDVMRNEILRIKRHIQTAVFEFRTPKEIELYVHNMQQSLISLCFRALRQLLPGDQSTIYKTSTEFTDTDILKSCFISLERILRFLEKHYLKYVDENIQIPFRSSLIKTYRIAEKLELVKSALLSCGIDLALLRIIYVPLLKLNSISLKDRITYHELIYANTYLDAFYHEIKGSGSGLGLKQITDVLYLINYNSLDLQLYEVAAIKSSLDAVSGVTEKIDYLYHRLKLINQRSCRINIKFDPGLPSLKEQLSTWIEEEITYLNKHLLLEAKQAPINLFTETEKPKLQSVYTVAQLALFYRLQADAGIITNKLQTDIFKHIADNYKTSRTMDISPDSVKNRFYNIDHTAIEAVKEKTIELLNQLQIVQPDV
ncbi:MAG: hypothetical protein K0S33_694 [Bacteroidetes bacterium]|jgi:hypothetical protein|nr:hypothetical protein [Bacteroidota bacterium]